MKSTAKLIILAPYLLSCNSVSKQPEEKGKPNIIFILADDLSAKELSLYGNKEHHTPNIDKLAEEGMYFSTCWGAAVCSPSRAILLTGKYAYQTNWYSVMMTPRGEERNALLYKHNTLISHIAKKAGYVTAMSGKWQMGGGDPTLDWGWDEWSLPWKYLPWHGVVCPDSFILAGQVPMYWGGPFGSNGVAVKTTPEDFTEDMHNDFILDFITRHRDVPFFYYYTTNLPHNSWEYEHRNPEDFNKKTGLYKWMYVEMPERDATGKQLYNEDGTKKKTAGTLKTNIEYLDYQVGKLVNKLKELGIYDKTIIVFTADNATVGWKGSVEEEHGQRVPLIIRGPGILKKELPEAALVDFSDMLPTLAEIMGVNLPENERFDGKSFLPVLQGDSPGEREWIYTNHEKYRMFRTGQWILDGHETLWFCGINRDHHGYEKMSPADDRAREIMDQFNLLSDLIPPVDTTAEFYTRKASYYGNYKKVKEQENRTSHLDAP